MPYGTHIDDAELVYLIELAHADDAPRRRAAKLLLHCVRTCPTIQEIKACLDEASTLKSSLSQIARELAEEVGLKLPG